MKAIDVYSLIVKALGTDGYSGRVDARDVISAVQEASAELLQTAYAKSANGATVPNDDLLKQIILNYQGTVSYSFADMLKGTPDNCFITKPKESCIFDEDDYPLGIELPSNFKMVDSIWTDTTANPNIIDEYEDGTDYDVAPDVQAGIGVIVRKNVKTKETTMDLYQAQFKNSYEMPYNDLVLFVLADGRIDAAIDPLTGNTRVKGVYDFRSAKYGAVFYVNGNVESGNVLPKGKYDGKARMAWIVAGEAQTPIKLKLTYIKTHLDFYVDLTNSANNIDLITTDDIAKMIIDGAVAIIVAKNVSAEGQYQVSNNEVAKNQTNRIN